MNIENSIITCSWKKSRGWFLLWENKYPNHVIRSSKFDKAHEKLWTDISIRTGECDHYIEFTPPPPISDKYVMFTRPEYISIHSNEVVEIEKHSSGLFEGGFCENCYSPIGRRTDTILKVPNAPNGSIFSVKLENSLLTIYSEELILFLRSLNLVFETRAVDVGKNTKQTNFYEIFSENGSSECGVKMFENLDIRKGFECSKCGFQSIYYIVSELSAIRFIPYSEVVDKDVLFVKSSNSIYADEVCLSSRIWSELVGSSRFDGIVSGGVGVVPEREVIISPKLELV